MQSIMTQVSLISQHLAGLDGRLAAQERFSLERERVAPGDPGTPLPSLTQSSSAIVCAGRSAAPLPSAELSSVGARPRPPVTVSPGAGTVREIEGERSPHGHPRHTWGIQACMTGGEVPSRPGPSRSARGLTERDRRVGDESTDSDLGRILRYTTQERPVPVQPVRSGRSGPAGPVRPVRSGRSGPVQPVRSGPAGPVRPVRRSGSAGSAGPAGRSGPVRPIFSAGTLTGGRVSRAGRPVRSGPVRSAGRSGPVQPVRPVRPVRSGPAGPVRSSRSGPVRPVRSGPAGPVRSVRSGSEREFSHSPLFVSASGRCAPTHTTARQRSRSPVSALSVSPQVRQRQSSVSSWSPESERDSRGRRRRRQRVSSGSRSPLKRRRRQSPVSRTRSAAIHFGHRRSRSQSRSSDDLSDRDASPDTSGASIREALLDSVQFIREMMAHAIPAETSGSTVRPRSSSLMAAELGYGEEAKPALPFSDTLRS